MEVQDLFLGKYRMVVLLLRGGVKERVNNALVYKKGGNNYLKYQNRSFAPNTKVIRARTA